eukprot:3953946-Pleurochrysis_carterae.AAC.1
MPGREKKVRKLCDVLRVAPLPHLDWQQLLQLRPSAQPPRVGVPAADSQRAGNVQAETRHRERGSKVERDRR